MECFRSSSHHKTKTWVPSGSRCLPSESRTDFRSFFHTTCLVCWWKTHTHILSTQDDFHKPRGHALFSSLGRRMSRSLVTSNVVLCLFIVFRSFAHLYAVDIEKLLKFALCKKKVDLFMRHKIMSQLIDPTRCATHRIHDCPTWNEFFSSWGLLVPEPVWPLDAT